MGPYLTLRERHDRKLAAYRDAVEALKPVLSAYAHEHGGRFIMYGSAARDTPHDQSDVDIIADFPERGAVPACSFADERCWALGLTPDVRPIDWTSDKVVARALEEGIVLGGHAMMAERWRDVSDDLASSKRHFAEAVALFGRQAGRMSLAESYLEVMAFQHAMQAGYTSFESALRRLLAFLDEALPQGSDWHAVLLRRVAEPLEGLRPAILSETLAEAADELLRFRHVAIHSYDRFKERKAAIAVEAAEIFLARIDAEIATFRAVIDPD